MTLSDKIGHIANCINIGLIYFSKLYKYFSINIASYLKHHHNMQKNPKEFDKTNSISIAPTG